MIQTNVISASKTISLFLTNIANGGVPPQAKDLYVFLLIRLTSH